MSNTVKPVFGKFGPKHDYRGSHAVLTYGKRELLGEIKSVYYNESTGAYLCRVTYMNGEEWPIRPALYALEILRRDRD